MTISATLHSDATRQQADAWRRQTSLRRFYTALGDDMTAKLTAFFTDLPKKDKACFEGVEGGDFTGYVPVKPDFYNVIVEARKAAIGG